ncbi:MAG: T9SS type A sorting domain-containing protein, partial [Bacteroidota bacterium]
IGGMEDSDDRNLVKIFPNPCRNYVTIEASALYQISIYTPDGRLMLTHKMRNPTETLDLTGFYTGIYIVHFSGAGIRFVKKLAVGI